MRDFHQIIKDTKPFTEEVRWLSWWHLVSTLAVMGGLLYLTLAPIALGWRIFASIFLGFVTVRMFILYHDYEHGAILRDSFIAKVWMSFFGTLVLNPPNVWNRSHNFHHSKNSQIATASIGSFPIMTWKEYHRADRWTRMRYRMARSGFVFLSGHLIIFVVGMCLKSFVTDPKRHWDSLVALLLHGAIIVGLYQFGWAVLLLSYIVPLYVSCMVGAYLFYIQHNFPDMQLKPREEWDYGFAALRSSSYMQGSWLTHWLTGNIGYHHVHHINSRIPFYRLPQAMQAVPELRDPGRTSLKPWDIYRCLRLKLWDTERQKMVSFSGNQP